MKKKVFEYEDYNEYMFEQESDSKYIISETQFYIILTESLVEFENWKIWTNVQRKIK